MPRARGLERQHNLPLRLTSIVGRAQDVQDITARLADPACRLLTLVGPGGVGKTRLGLEVATASLGGYADGVWFIELGALSDAALVPQAVASALGLKDQPDRSTVDSLTSQLRAQHILLVLDNCEHLPAASARLAHALLADCPLLKVIATSREPLHVAGEVNWPVPPVSLPDLDRPPPAEGAIESDAVKLFLERARDAYPAFTLTERNGPLIAQVCHRLDGLPLAIELAAARVRFLSVAQIADRLDDRFSLLAGSDRTAPTRHETLEAALDWSHDLLSESERLLFRRLSVFAGGFDLDAAETVCSGAGTKPDEILDLLGRLVDKSLVMVGRGEGSGRRFRLLETVRQYGEEKLDASGEQARLGGRHLSYYLALADEAQPGELWGAAEAAWLDRLESERENMRRALAWSLQSGDAEQGLRLATGLVWFWYVRAHLNEGVHWLEQALAANGGAQAPSRAVALNAAGSLAVLQGDYERAAELLRESIALDCDEGCSVLAAWSLQELGLGDLFAGRYTRAERHFTESRALFEEFGDEAGLASVLLYEAIAACYQKRYERAEALLEGCLPLLRSLGDGIGLARGLHCLGVAASRTDDPERGKSLFVEALETAREKGGRFEILQCLEGLAGVAADRGQADHAACLFGAAETLRKEIGAELPFGLQLDYDRDVAAVRSHLGGEQFQAAWSAGSALTMRQAIDRALQGPEEAGPAVAEAPEARPLTALQAAKREYGGLTTRERQVAGLVAQGKTNAAIAQELVVTVRTVEAHMTHIFSKLGFLSRTQVAGWAIGRGLALPPQTLDESMRAK